MTVEFAIDFGNGLGWRRATFPLLVTSSVLQPNTHYMSILLHTCFLPNLSYMFRCVTYHPQRKLHILLQNCQLWVLSKYRKFCLKMVYNKPKHIREVWYNICINISFVFGLSIEDILIHENARNLKLNDSDRLLFVTCNFFIPVRNAMGSSTTLLSAFDIRQLFAVVFCVG
jgi:hypothetical protein